MRANAASTRERSVNGPFAASSMSEASRSRSSSSAFGAPDRFPSDCTPNAAVASVTAFPVWRPITADLSEPLQRQVGRARPGVGAGKLDQDSGPRTVVVFGR